MLSLALSAFALVLVGGAGTAALRARPRGIGHYSRRAAALLGLALFSAAGPVVVEVGGVPRAVVGFGVLLLAPGAALLGFAPLRAPLSELPLALAISMTLLLVLGELMLALGIWHPIYLYAALSVASAPVLAWHAARDLEAKPARFEEIDAVA